MYLFLERERGREGENHQLWVPLVHLSTEDLAPNPGMCPDWELNQWPLASQSGAQSTEPHQPGHALENS